MKRVMLLTALIVGLGTSTLATADVFKANFEVIYNPYMATGNYYLAVDNLADAVGLQEYDAFERNLMVIHNPAMQERLYQITTYEPVSQEKPEQGDIFEANFKTIENPRYWEL